MEDHIELQTFGGIETIAGFSILSEVPVDHDRAPPDMQPELVQLLRDLDIYDNDGIQELRWRVKFETLADLLVIIGWTAKDWVRHLGSLAAWRLGSGSIFFLSRLSHIEELLGHLRNAVRDEGWQLTVTEEHLHALSLELNSQISLCRWNNELRKAVEREIEQHSRESRNPNTQGESSNTAWSGIGQPCDALSLPPTTSWFRTGWHPKQLYWLLLPKADPIAMNAIKPVGRDTSFTSF